MRELRVQPVGVREQLLGSLRALALAHLELPLFFPSVPERTFATATSFVAVAAAPRWSALRDRPAFEGEAAVRKLDLTVPLPMTWDRGSRDPK